MKNIAKMLLLLTAGLGIGTLPGYPGAPAPAQALSQKAFSERVFARALMAGDAHACETWLALQGQSPQLTIQLTPSLRLHPISVVLTRTAWNRQTDMLSHLLKWGAQLNYQEPDLQFKTPLHLALEIEVETQASELVHFILSHHGQGALAVADKNQETPLDLAHKRYPALGQSLEKFKAVQLSPMELLHPPTAWARGEKALLRFEQEQALFEALAETNPGKLQSALQAGALATARSLEQKWETPLHQALALPDSAKRRALIQLLLNQEAAREAEDWQGNRPLHRAAVSGQIKDLEALHTLGVDLNSRNIDGQTPLALAALAGQSESVTWLVKAGAQKTLADNAGETPAEKITKKLAQPELSAQARNDLEAILKWL
ncbi:MAG: ankyrin repeat domain-containing protein [Candidatus Sericytochromatia bacterium]